MIFLILGFIMIINHLLHHMEVICIRGNNCCEPASLSTIDWHNASMPYYVQSWSWADVLRSYLFMYEGQTTSSLIICICMWSHQRDWTHLTTVAPSEIVISVHWWSHFASYNYYCRFHAPCCVHYTVPLAPGSYHGTCIIPPCLGYQVIVVFSMTWK